MHLVGMIPEKVAYRREFDLFVVLQIEDCVQDASLDQYINKLERFHEFLVATCRNVQNSCKNLSKYKWFNRDVFI